MTSDEVLAALRAAADPTRLPGMARVGIRTSDAIGVSVPDVRRIAKRAGTDQTLARQLWATGVHEARMVAANVANPVAFSFREMTAWARDLDSWDVTDMLADTFAATHHADRAISTWARSRHGFTKRCAFAMVARRAVARDTIPDTVFLGYLHLIRPAATDDRNEVKKGVNWALRQIGKRDRALHAAAITEAEELLTLGDRTARWIARDALRELRKPATIALIRA
jgi:3-methyladenine DNA glycosylase AlkD